MTMILEIAKMRSHTLSFSLSFLPPLSFFIDKPFTRASRSRGYPLVMETD
jgi:hypothetical protein